MPLLPPYGDPDFAFSFDQEGPWLGSVRLLDKFAFGYVVPTRHALAAKLASAFAGDFDLGVLEVELALVCRTMNEGDLAKAAMATAFLQLPPILPEGEPGRVAKASPEDPKHPGWPKDAPDGKGGQYRPLDGADSTLTFEDKARRVARLNERRKLRSVLRRVLTTKRALRTLGEVLGDAVPGLDLITGPATIADDILLMRDIAEDLAESRAAIAFAEAGPRQIEDLLVSTEARSFSSYRNFVKVDLEKYYGSAGEGYQYHHIVEQRPNAGLMGAETLQSTENIIRIPTLLHEEVTAVYARSYEFSTGRMPLRDYLRGASIEQQRAWGIWALQQVGAIH